MKVSRDTKKWTISRNINGYHAWGLVVTITDRMPHWHGITQQTLFSENPSYPKATQLGLGLEFFSFFGNLLSKKTFTEDEEAWVTS